MATKIFSHIFTARPFFRPSGTLTSCLRLIRSSPSTLRYDALVVFSASQNFHISARQLKKKSRADRDAEEEIRAAAQNQDTDPRDFSTLLADIEKCTLKLTGELGKLRSGGRFNPEILEDLRVKVRGTKKTERLGDLAQVLPKGGRSLIILVGEKDHVKSVISAIQTSNLNLQPQSDCLEPLQLNVPSPPPTKESRILALETITKAGETAGLGVRAARGVMQKKLRQMELKKLARPDDLKKAHKEMDKIIEKSMADIKKAVDAAQKTMEQTLQ